MTWKEVRELLPDDDSPAMIGIPCEGGGYRWYDISEVAEVTSGPRDGGTCVLSDSLLVKEKA